MSRASEIFGRLDKDDYSDSLSLQVEAYHQIQNQALRILRTIIAIVGIGVAIASVMNFGVPQTEMSRAGGNLLFENFKQDLGEKHLSLALLFLVISALLFTEAVFHLSTLLRTPQPVPFLGRRNSPDNRTSGNFVAWDYYGADEFPEYIASNSKLLARMSLCLDKAYAMLTGAVVFVVIAAVIAAISISRPGSLLTLVDTIILFVFPITWVIALLFPPIWAISAIRAQEANFTLSTFYKSYTWSNGIFPNWFVTLLIGYVWFKLIEPYMAGYRSIWLSLPN